MASSPESERRDFDPGIFYLDMKVFRAKKHLDELIVTVNEYSNDAYLITRKDYSQKHRHVIRFEVKAMPYEIGMLAGEFAYCLRSGLDQLAWQLALLNTKHPRSETSFPIRRTVPATGPDRRFREATRDIPAAAISAIELLQPYQKPDPASKTHPLWLLNELCNIDKHMILPVRASEANVDVFAADIRRRRDTANGFELYFDITDKYKIQIPPIKVAVIFGAPAWLHSGFEMRLTHFTAIYDFVRDQVIPAFSPFF